ncbi:hypothetical protein BCON_0098g00080 [Botryotinia convoluta]|uniref:Uncharacterized protein n=1 Tax=Botryotinia convoluta TaxID=54673 RepID=A0A4Z1I0W6_9HELO|nr:hypothetical protein BCON_0098g00080 [Botryotinia convoluta]
MEVVAEPKSRLYHNKKLAKQGKRLMANGKGQLPNTSTSQFPDHRGSNAETDPRGPVPQSTPAPQRQPITTKVPLCALER